jgi:hypothetical protein
MFIFVGCVSCNKVVESVFKIFVSPRSNNAIENR